MTSGPINSKLVHEALALAFTPSLPTPLPTHTPANPQIAHAPHRLVSIRSVDEAVVIGAALSMSSSAFVLQLLRERGELATKFGNATLGVLLFQVG